VLELSKQNLKFFNKVKRLDKEQRENFINALKSHTTKFSDRIFNEILNKKKPDQLRVLRQIVLSLTFKEIEEIFGKYENQYNLIKRQKEEKVPTYLKVNDIDEVKKIIEEASDRILNFEPKDIVWRGLRRFLLFHDLQFPKYIFNELIEILFLIKNEQVNLQKVDDNQRYINELLGLDILKQYIIDIFNNIDINYRIPIIVGFLLWNLFEQEITNQYDLNNRHYFFPYEEIGNFELKIYESLVKVLKQKFSDIFYDLEVLSLIRMIEDLYNLIKNTIIIIEPWKEYLHG